MRRDSVPIDSGCGLGAEIAVLGVEIDCTDAVFTADATELHATVLDPIGGVVSHDVIVVLCWEEGQYNSGVPKVSQ